jgi:transcriptional regulator with XRE-family HTH domain
MATGTVHNQIFFTNILRLLDERGMTKNELAAKADISVSFLSDLTNGKANPSLKIMEAIAEALETPLPTLLESTDLDRESLDALAGGNAPRSLPEGVVRVSAVLPEHQAFIVKKWDEAARNKLRSKPS